MDWLWWVGAALVLGILEMISLSLVLAMLAGGALAAAVVEMLDGPWWAQWLTMALVSAVLLVALRPWLVRQIARRRPLKETNTAALLGHGAVVVAAVDGETGRVKIGGEVWSARTDGTETFEPGTEVVVSRIDGATAVVSSVHRA